MMTKPETSQRARRDTRLSDPPPIRLTERDVAIVHAVYLYRLLTTQQLQTLFFPSLHQAYARLSLLYHHGFLDRRFLSVHADKMNTPILYVLDKRGADLLRADRGLEVGWTKRGKKLTALFIQHTLAINTVRIAIAKACEATTGYRLEKWLDETALKGDYDRVTIRSQTGRVVNVSLIPDSFFVLETPLGTAAFCLEVDRSTETLNRFKTKVVAYQAYYAGGGYQRRFETKSLRVLTITTSSPRLANLRRVTEAADGKARFWFTTLDKVPPTSVLNAPIWLVASKDGVHPLIDTTP